MVGTNKQPTVNKLIYLLRNVIIHSEIQFPVLPVTRLGTDIFFISICYLFYSHERNFSLEAIASNRL